MHIITRSATHTGTLPDDGIALRLGQVRNLQTAITEDHTRSVTWLCRWPIALSHSEQGPSCVWFADWKYLGSFLTSSLSAVIAGSFYQFLLI